MRSAVICATVLALSTGTALAQSSGIAKDTTTSMGTPMESPSEAAPRSAQMPGSPAHQHAVAAGKDPSKVAKCDSFHPSQHCIPPSANQPAG
jgi:hypothetical protein